MTDEPTPIRPATEESPAAEPQPSRKRPDPRGDIEYIVLVRGDTPDWTQLGKHKAKNPDAAIEDAIGEGDPAGLDYVAIASRYWSPQQYEVIETKVREIVRKGAS